MACSRPPGEACALALQARNHLVPGHLLHFGQQLLVVVLPLELRIEVCSSVLHLSHHTARKPILSLCTLCRGAPAVLTFKEASRPQNLMAAMSYACAASASLDHPPRYTCLPFVRPVLPCASAW